MSSTECQQNTGVPYNGLRNQGSTCYLNSVLQVLFMTPDFREALQRSPPESIDSHLKELFDELERFDGFTYKITKALGITNVYSQADAAECFEKILRKMTNPEASQIFQGVLRVKNKCSTCNTETCDDNPCWSLPLELVDSEAEYRVEDGITQYFHPSEVSGLDQLFCGNCNTKTDSTLKLELKHHPEVLMLLLKRFKFDYHHRQYYKVERRVGLPLILEIQSQTYELYAFVEHGGNLKNGHYTANIKSHEDGTWYHFNDNRVNRCYQFFQLENRETSRSAYLLFYRKISAEEALNEESNKACTPESSEIHRGETNEPKENREETVVRQKSHDSKESQETEETERKLISMEKENLRDQMRMSLMKEEENLRDQMRMSLMKEKENLRDQMRISLMKEKENLRDQMRMSLMKEEENSREQMRMSLMKEEESSREQMRISLMKEEENSREQMRISLMKEEENSREQMRISLMKEEESSREQMRMSLMKEEEIVREQMRMGLMKEEEIVREQMRMNLMKEKETLKYQVMILKQKDENLPEHQTKASKPLTYYDLYKNPLQNSESEGRVRSLERSQQLEGENSRRSTQHEQKSKYKSTENKIYPGNPTGSRSIQRSVNTETVEIHRAGFRADPVHSRSVSSLVKGSESLSNEAWGQSREDPSNMSAERDAGSRKSSHVQQGTTLTNDGSGVVQHFGELCYSSISFRLQNPNSGKKIDIVTKITQEEELVYVVPRGKCSKEAGDDQQHKHNNQQMSERNSQNEPTLNHPESCSYDRNKRTTNRSKKGEESESSCNREDHQTDLLKKTIHQDATYGFPRNFQQRSPEMTSEHTAPTTCDPVNGLINSVQKLTLADGQEHEGNLTNTHKKPAAPSDSLVIPTPFGSSMEPMNYISSPREPADSKSGSGFRTSPQFRFESLERESRAELNRDCRGRDSADSQVITVESADPEAVRVLQFKPSTAQIPNSGTESINVLNHTR